MKDFTTELSNTTDLRVLVVADDLLARAGLTALLAAETGIDIVGQVAVDNESGLADALDVYRPDVMLLDLGMDGMDDPALILVEPALPVVVLIAEDDDLSDVLNALRSSGGYGLLYRESSGSQLATAIHAAAGGLTVFDPLLAAGIIPSVGQTPAQGRISLTPREAEVLQYLAAGMTNKAIASALKISPNTVKFHVNTILSKLDAQSRTEAVVRASQLGLISL